jgi:hypothetical protein
MNRNLKDEELSCTQGQSHLYPELLQSHLWYDDELTATLSSDLG